ncbi:SufD family Fe-S cluster assembly protein [Patescibacteria group bacterium]|nr:SufD family Fe-S cluster assembly protein [Patescibacteria group bacterium]MBU0964426.1 SufD family Fe-S cluster assembly protein [Patescibacteria group bacterium]
MKPILLNKNQVLEIGQKKAEFVINSGIKAVLIIKKSGKFTVNIKKDGNVQVLYFIRHQSALDSKVIINLEGTGAEARVSGALHGHRNDRHQVKINLNHNVKQTKGYILVKGVYEGKSRGNINGLIKIDKKAQQVDSLFTNNVLLLDQAMAISKPQLEIEANDVRASHGSTTSRVDQEQLFYLTSRGIKKKVAEKMIISGFLNEAIRRFPRKVLPLIVKK